MNNIHIDLDEETKFYVFYDNASKLFHISGQQEQLRFTIDGMELKELKQLKKEINKILKDKHVMKYFKEEDKTKPDMTDWDNPNVGMATLEKYRGD